jgi:hypothetical protein
MCTNCNTPTFARLKDHAARGTMPDQGWATNLTFGDLVGKTCLNVEVGDDFIAFVFLDGTIAKMYHAQDCCEDVSIEDINGDVGDLIGTPLLVCDERTNSVEGGDYESATWTFYTLRTIRGSVDIRWLGVSNGYYSESVDLWSAEPGIPLSAHTKMALLREAMDTEQDGPSGPS